MEDSPTLALVAPLRPRSRVGGLGVLHYPSKDQAFEQQPAVSCGGAAYEPNDMAG